MQPSLRNKTVDLDAGFETKDTDFETKDADFETKDAGFATKCENLFARIQYFSMCLAAAEKVLWPIIRQ
jgi:hypothetical protein